MIWEGFYYAGSGYGEAARQYTLALDALGMAVTAKLAPCQDDRHLLAKDVLARLERLMKRRPEPGEVWVQQVLPTAFTVAPGAGANVGYTVFEADGIPRHWARACNRMDEVWVPSQFCVESFSGSGVKLGKLRVIPHGVDVRRFGPGTQPLEIEGARGFVFLSVFDWVKRKGWDLLLRAYWSEFEASEEVCLVLRISRFNPAELAEFVSREFGGGPRAALLVLPFPVPQDLMPGLYAAADAFVLPSRGEAWGLPYSEAMAMGLPTIATKWGGHLDFMHQGNSYLVEVDRMVSMDQETQAILKAEPGLQWAEPSVDGLRQAMRRVFEQPSEAKARGEAARSEMTSRGTWERAAVAVWERAEALGEFREMSLKSRLQSLAERSFELGQRDDAERLADAISARMGELERAESVASLILEQLNKRTPPGRKE